MKRETFSLALNALDDRYISEAAAFRPERMRESPKRTGRGNRKRLIAFALAAALILGLGAVAYAANLFGLRELYANPNRGEMPEEAARLIADQGAELEGDGWRARVLESYCDEGTALMTVRLSADEGYLVAPADEDPDSPLWTVGLSGEGKLGDYARREGKTLLFAEAVLDGETLGLTSAGLRFEQASPREMTIYFEGARSGGAAGDVKATCRIVVLAWPPDADAQDPDSYVVERHELPITLTDGGGSLLGRYAPQDPHAVPGVELGELSLTRTPLGIELRLDMTLLDRDAAERLLTLRLDGVEFHGSGVLDPYSGAVFSQGQGDFGERPTVRFLGWDKNTVASVTFEKIG